MLKWLFKSKKPGIFCPANWGYWLHIHSLVKEWMVKELIDGPCWFWIPISRGPMTFDEAKNFLEIVRASGQTGDDGRFKRSHWFTMLPYEPDTELASEQTLVEYEELVEKHSYRR